MNTPSERSFDGPVSGYRGVEPQTRTKSVNREDLVEILDARGGLDLHEDDDRVVCLREILARAGAPREVRERAPEPTHTPRREPRRRNYRLRLCARRHLEPQPTGQRVHQDPQQ